MSEIITKYLPFDWIDEVVPEPQENPASFIHHNETLGWHLRPVDEEPSDDPDDFTWLTKLESGQVVSFETTRNFGDFKLMIASDGSWSTDRVIPSEANCFRLNWDSDSICDEITTLVEHGSDTDGRLAEGIHDIDAYFWSRVDHLFRFEITDGKGVLVPCGVTQ